MKNTQEQFKEIFEQSAKEKIIPFLKELSKEERKKIAAILKKMNDEYLKYEYIREGNNQRWERKANGKQAFILLVASFVCLGQKETKRDDYLHKIIKKEVLDQILTWYCPTWFNTYIQEITKVESIHYWLDYEWVMEMADMGYIQPSETLMTNLLIYHIYDRDDKKTHIYNDAKIHIAPLLKRKITLETHIWYLFQYPTDIHRLGRKVYRGTNKKPKGVNATHWHEIFKILVDEEKIDRNQVLKEALAATNRNFNRDLTIWFSDLFLYFDPTNEELISLQTDLFNTFYSPQGKPVKMVLELLKKLVKHPQFQSVTILEHADILLNSAVKSVVTETLNLFDKMAANAPKATALICQKVCQALIQNEEGIQSKVAKIIVKYGQVNDENLRQELALYKDSLLHNTKTALQDFLPDNEGESLTEIEVQTPIYLIREDKKIPSVETFDDFIFLASQAFDNNESYHFDLFPAALLKFHSKINQNNIHKLLPAIQRAYKLRRDGQGFQKAGVLDRLLSLFFIHYVQKILVPKFYEQLQNLEKYNDGARLTLTPLNKWKYQSYDSYKHKFHHSSIYILFSNHLVAVSQLLETDHNLPLLSTPTHSPHWIDPIVLIQRLALYQKAKIEPSSLDLQLALARTALDDVKNAIAFAKQTLSGDLLKLIYYLLGADSFDIKSPLYLQYMLMALITKYPEMVSFKVTNTDPSTPNAFSTNVYFTGKFYYTMAIPAKKVIRYNAKTEKQEPTKYENLIIHFPELIETPDLLNESLMYPYFLNIQDNFIDNPNDLKRIYGLLPNQPEIITTTLIYPKIDRQYGSNLSWEVDETVYGDAFANSLLAQEVPFQQMGHITLAYFIQCGSKTARLIASEIWINGVTNNMVNSIELGKFIGLLQRGIYAPLKRITDLLNDHMLNISLTHNKALEQLIYTCLLHMGDEPIRNTKKLLEIYIELLSLNNSKPTTELLEHLQKWSASSSLKKIIKSIELF